MTDSSAEDGLSLRILAECFARQGEKNNEIAEGYSN
jgi:hypothetical protein